MRSAGVPLGTASVVLALILGTAPSTSAQQAVGQAGPPSLRDKTAEQAYKNIQVLHGTPADQVVPAMRFVSQSLGVGCVFCHDTQDFSKDTKDAKATARKMMQMQFDINKVSFDGRNAVTCNSCHNGHNDPVAVPAIPESSMAVPAEGISPAGQQLPMVDQIIAKYVEALGGEQALRAIASRTVTGSIDFGASARGPAAHGTFEELEKAPNLWLMAMRMPNGTLQTAFDGSTAWALLPNGTANTAESGLQGRVKRDSDFYQPLDMKHLYSRLAVRGIAKVGDRDAYVVFAVPQGEPAERFYFDTQTGLLLRYWAVSQTPLGNNAMQRDFSDYRDAGGVKLAFTVKITDTDGDPSERTIRVSNVENNTTVDDGRFNKP